jgi:hypothetical protein
MEAKIEHFKQSVIESAANPEFIHHQWFVKYHLDIVEQIAFDLLEHYTQADKNIVKVMVWMHDYGKTIDLDAQYEQTLAAGENKLKELDFDAGFIKRVVEYCEILDKKLELDLRGAPIEVQIVSSADGCSHLVGPFMYLWWLENSNKNYEDLMADNRRKLGKDWSHKIVLPEAKEAFRGRYEVTLEQTGQLPNSYISPDAKSQ